MKGSGRVVFDTGTLVSATLRATATADRAFALALRHGVVCVCEQSLERLRAVLGKSKLDRYMGKRARLAFAEVLLRNAWACTVSADDVSKIRPSCRDRGNNVILALAAVAEADFIVSCEPDLLARKVWRGIPIITPTEFVDRFDPA